MSRRYYPFWINILLNIAVMPTAYLLYYLYKSTNSVVYSLLSALQKVIRTFIPVGTFENIPYRYNQILLSRTQVCTKSKVRLSRFSWNDNERRIESKSTFDSLFDTDSYTQAASGSEWHFEYYTNAEQECKKY